MDILFLNNCNLSDLYWFTEIVDLENITLDRNILTDDDNNDIKKL